MRGQARAAFDQHAGAERLQLGGDFRNDGDAGFVGGGLLEDTHDDRHARYLPKTLNYGIRVDYL
jgi:hypothetical protein